MPSTLNFQARILTPTNQPLELPSVDFKFKYTNAAGTCVLYEENFDNVSMVGSNGLVTLNMGGGTKIFPLTATNLYDVFNYGNSIDCLSVGTTGNTGTPIAPVTPTVLEKRQVIVEFNDGSGWQGLPGMSLNSVPYSLHARMAYNANQLGGVAATNYIKFSDVVAAGCTAAQALRYDGTNFVCEATGGGSVTSVAGRNGVVVLSSSDITGLTFGTAANTFAQGNDSRFTDARTPTGAASGDLTGTYPNPTLANVVTAGTASKVTFDAKGRIISASALVSTDITSALGFTPTNSSGDVTSVAGRTGAVTLSSSDITGLSFGTAANTFAQGNDSRFTDARAPTGTASGDLTGTYPNPTLANNVVTSQNILNATITSADLSNASVEAANLAQMGAVNGNVMKWNGSAWVPAIAVSVVNWGSGARIFTNITSGSQINLKTIRGTANQVVSTEDTDYVTLSLPQSIHTGASPTFTGMTLSGMSSAGFVKNTSGGVLSGGNSIVSSDVTGLTFGTAANTFAQGNDSRFTDSRTPTGAASGDLTGTYPNPTLTTTGVVASSDYTKVTVDAKGRVTGAGYLASTDITTLYGYTPASAASSVTSVAGRTGVVTLSSSDITGLTFGTAANTFAQGNDSRFTDSRTPSGAASGDLTGTYPNPTLVNVVTAGTSSKVTFDAKGRIVSSAALVSTDITGPLGFIPVNTIGAVTSVAGRTGVVTLSSSDITGLTFGTAANTFAQGNDSRFTDSRTPSGAASGDLTGTYPNPTLVNVVTAGTSSKVTFDAKGRIVSSAPLVSTDITSALGFTPTNSSGDVTSVAGRTGAVTLSSSDITGLSFGTAANTFAQGNDSRFTDARAPTGTASGDLTGTYPNPTLTTTGVTASSDYTKVTVDAKGRVTGAGYLASTDITTLYGYTPASSSAVFLQNGNSFGAEAVLGTNDNRKLSFETNGSTRMTVNETGQVGIGISPSGVEALIISSDLSRALTLTSNAMGTTPVFFTNTTVSNSFKMGMSGAGAMNPNLFYINDDGGSYTGGFSMNSSGNIGMGMEPEGARKLAVTGNSLFYSDSLVARSQTNNSGTFQVQRNNAAVVLSVNTDTPSMVMSGSIGVGVTPGTSLDVSGAITSRPFGTGTGQTGQLILRELASNGSHSVILKAADSVSADLTFTLPNVDGSSGQVLSTNGSGDLSWVTGGGSVSNVATLANGKIWIGDGGGVAQEQTVSGDLTLSNTGVAAISSNAIGSSEITDASITSADMDFTGVNVATSSFVIRDSTGKFYNFACSTAGEVPTWTVAGFVCQTPSSLSGYTQSASPFLTALGYQSGQSVTGVYNTHIGHRSGDAITVGSYNATLGAGALGSAVSADNNVAIGYNALATSTANSNVAIGHSAGYQLSVSDNVAVGYRSLNIATSGGQNTAVGSDSALSLTTGTHVSVFGASAALYNTGSFNTAIGTRSMRGDSGTSTGGYNTGVGALSLYYLTTGQYNSVLGYSAGFNITSGSSNVAIGDDALRSLNSGAGNTVLGAKAGYTTTTANAVTTGSNNTFIGYNAGPGTPTQLTNATAIGYGAQVSADNSMVLGNTSVNVGIGTSEPTEKLDVAGNVKATNFISTSDERLKANIVQVEGLRVVRNIAGYSYDWKNNGQSDYGVIAQEVEKVMPDAVVTNKDTGLKAVKYNALIAPLIEAVKELYAKWLMDHERIADLEFENQKLKNKSEELEERLQRLEQKK